jgi:hypothetical protein
MILLVATAFLKCSGAGAFMGWARRRKSCKPPQNREGKRALEILDFLVTNGK